MHKGPIVRQLQILSEAKSNWPYYQRAPLSFSKMWLTSPFEPGLLLPLLPPQAVLSWLSGTTRPMEECHIQLCAALMADGCLPRAGTSVERQLVSNLKNHWNTRNGQVQCGKSEREEPLFLMSGRSPAGAMLALGEKRGPVSSGNQSTLTRHLLSLTR